jgi:hypothetical protein
MTWKAFDLSANRGDASVGFIRQQEENMAVRLLAWHYQRREMGLPPQGELQQRAKILVDEAHRIARQRGRNVLTIMKELVDEIKQK